MALLGIAVPPAAALRALVASVDVDESGAIEARLPPKGGAVPSFFVCWNARRESASSGRRGVSRNGARRRFDRARQVRSMSSSISGVSRLATQSRFLCRFDQLEEFITMLAPKYLRAAAAGQTVSIESIEAAGAERDDDDAAAASGAAVGDRARASGVLAAMTMTERRGGPNVPCVVATDGGAAAASDAPKRCEIESDEEMKQGDEKETTVDDEQTMQGMSVVSVQVQPAKKVRWADRPVPTMLDRAASLVDDGNALKDRGDTRGALAKYEEARACGEAAEDAAAVGGAVAARDPVWLQHVSMLLVLGNTVVLALDRHPISCAEQARLERANLAFTLGFIVEMAVKLHYLGGPRAYWSDGTRAPTRR